LFASQGLNEIAALIWLLVRSRHTSLRQGEASQLLAVVVRKYLPRIYGSDDAFLSLQCSLRLFRLLLLYHDPQLCKVSIASCPPTPSTTPSRARPAPPRPVAPDHLHHAQSCLITRPIALHHVSGR